MDLGLRGLFQKGNPNLKSEIHKIDLDICGYSREGKLLSCSHINTVFTFMEHLLE